MSRNILGSRVFDDKINIESRSKLSTPVQWWSKSKIIPRFRLLVSIMEYPPQYHPVQVRWRIVMVKKGQQIPVESFESSPDVYPDGTSLLQSGVKGFENNTNLEIHMEFLENLKLHSGDRAVLLLEFDSPVPRTESDKPLPSYRIRGQWTCPVTPETEGFSSFLGNLRDKLEKSTHNHSNSIFW